MGNHCSVDYSGGEGVAGIHTYANSGHEVEGRGRSGSVRSLYANVEGECSKHIPTIVATGSSIVA